MDPTTFPLVQKPDLVRVGLFHTPVDFDYGGEAIAFNPSSRTLILVDQGGLAEITIPEPSLLDPSRASTLQPISYSMPWAMRADVGGPIPADKVGGVLVYNGKLIGNMYVYYDTENKQERSHFTCDLNLSNVASFKGWTQVGAPRQCGFVAGGMALVPPEWQSLLGGDVLTGQGGIPIISRTSFGPCAFVLDGSKVGEPVVPATMLLGYGGDHPTLGPWNNVVPSETFGMGTTIGGMVIVPGTRSLLYFGGHGFGAGCYGNGTADPALAGTPDPGGAGPLCFDPASQAHASHSYPYRYQVWAYDLNDLLSVKRGEKQPWEVVPYGVWPLDLGNITFPTECHVAIDHSTNRLYVSQYKGEETQGGGGIAQIHAIDVRVGTPLPPPVEPPVPPTPEPPTPVDPCEAVKVQVTSLTLALAAEKQRHDVTAAELNDAKSRLGTVNSEATGIIAHNNRLKPKDKLPSWCIEAVKRIETLSRAQ